VEEQVPDVVLAMWGRAPEGRRGPKPAMTVEQIARAAVAIADDEGLAAVSMAAVARQLGFTTMSLYRYVAAKEDLHMAMADVALGDPPALETGDWRARIEAWARAELAVLVAHPWVLEVRPGSPPLGPRTLAWMDAGLQALSGGHVPPAQVGSCLLLVDGFVRNQVLLGQQFGDGAGSRVWADRLRTVIDRERLPALAAGLDSGAFDDDTPGAFPGDEFDFGLRLVLDGIAAL
jgi:AcrR family transcriptional regulator